MTGAEADSPEGQLNRSWVRWLDDESADVADLGYKGAALARARRAGLPTLDGFCVTPKGVRCFLAHNGLFEKIRPLLRRVDVSGFEILPISIEIDRLVNATPFPAELEAEIRAAVDTLAGSASLLIARSSAMDEDTYTGSAAGLYTSRSGIQPEDAVNAIRDVVRSLYGPQALFYRRRHGIPSETASMAVLVQCQLQPDSLGVFFTVDPFGTGEFLMEWSCPGDSSGSVTDGAAPGGMLSHRPQSPPAWLDELVALGDRAAALLAGPADLEWARTEDGVLLLQLRPITTARRPVRTFTVVPADDEELIRHIDLRECGDLHARWRAKHVRVRRQARLAGIEVAACMYVEYGAASAAAAASAVAAELRTPYVFLDVTEDLRSIVVERTTLADNFALLASTEEAITVRVRECFTEHASLISGVYGGRKMVLIEHTPGGIKGLIRGLSAANRFLVGGEGEVRPLRIDAAGDHYLFDSTVLTFQRSQDRVESDTGVAKLGDDLLRRVADFTRQVSTGHMPRLEWSVADGEPYLIDHSMELATDTADLAAGWAVMSPGTASGLAMVLDDLGELEYLSDGNLISVRSVNPAVATDQALQDLLERAARLAESSGLVVVARRPATALALLIDIADAFIFDDGALLSHLAILLREARIPAVVLPSAASRITEGQQVLITSDGAVEITRLDVEGAAR